MKRRYYIDEQPLGSTSRSSDDVELLDETEQEELIHNLEKQTSFHHRIYRACFCVAGLLLGILYFYFAIIGEQFGDSQVGLFRVLFLHFITGIGFLLMSYRALFGRKTKSFHTDKESNDPLFLFYLTLVLSIIEIALWLIPPLIFKGELNAQLLIFPFVLPIYTIFVEYAIKLMENSEKQVSGLYFYMYKYKTA